MAEYRITPNHEFGHGFVVSTLGRTVASVVEVSKGEFTVSVGRTRYRIATSSGFSSAHQLVAGDSEVIVSAERPSTVGPRYVVRLSGGAVLDLIPVATFGNKCHVIQDGEIVGVIDPDDITTHDLSCELPDDVRPEVAAFLIWVVMDATRA